MASEDCYTASKVPKRMKGSQASSDVLSEREFAYTLPAVHPQYFTF
jgi:hypothetical protein